MATWQRDVFSAIVLLCVFVEFGVADVTPEGHYEESYFMKETILFHPPASTCFQRYTRTGDVIMIHYDARLGGPDGPIIETTRPPAVSEGKPASPSDGKPLVYMLGAQTVPKALDRGVRIACLGEKKTILAHPQYAYGQRGSSSLGVPPNSTVHFHVEFLGWRDPPADFLGPFESEESDEEELVRDEVEIRTLREKIAKLIAESDAEADGADMDKSIDKEKLEEIAREIEAAGTVKVKILDGSKAKENDENKNENENENVNDDDNETDETDENTENDSFDDGSNGNDDDDDDVFGGKTEL